MRRCPLCTGKAKDRAAIAHRSGLSDREIGRIFNVSRGKVRRHWEHVQNAPGQPSGDVVRELEQQVREWRKQLRDARKSGNGELAYRIHEKIVAAKARMAIAEPDEPDLPDQSELNRAVGTALDPNYVEKIRLALGFRARRSDDGQPVTIRTVFDEQEALTPAERDQTVLTWLRWKAEAEDGTPAMTACCWRLFHLVEGKPIPAAVERSIARIEAELDREGFNEPEKLVEADDVEAGATGIVGTEGFEGGDGDDLEEPEAGLDSESEARSPERLRSERTGGE